MLLDFSGSSFISEPADGENCMTSYCTDEGNTKHFVKVYCNNNSTSVAGVCGKYRLIDWLYS
jgi:translation initiation factor IF-1